MSLGFECAVSHIAGNAKGTDGVVIHIGLQRHVSSHQQRELLIRGEIASSADPQSLPIALDQGHCGISPAGCTSGI